MNSQIQDQQDAERRFDSAAFLKTVPELPGVYRMYNEKDQIIYVGKAKNLSNRLHSYFVKDLSSEKTRALVRNIHHIEFSITYSESDALILEQNLIKENRPKYNILLRDDKSYPYILITDDQYPAIYYHRGAKKLKGTYYGPYPNSSAVKDSLKILQNIFPVRQCSEATYRNRSRPCLMYQIKKCLGPCISGLVSDSEYRRNVELTAMFLSGRYNELISSLTGQMQQASDNCEFERAITIRDQIFALRKVQEQQVVDDYNSPDTDILGIQYRNGMACVNAMYHRHGQMIGTRNFFLKCSYDQDLKEILQAFIEQYYSEKMSFSIPAEIAVSPEYRFDEQLENTISEVCRRRIRFVYPVRGSRAKFLSLADENAKTAISSRIKSEDLQRERIEGIEQLFGLQQGSVNRMECYDISHTFGERTVASCVVFNRSGPLNSAYRIFNIEGITAGDDFAAMDQVLHRRFLHADSSDNFPDILFIDGGDGQLSQGEKVIQKAREKFPGYNPRIVGISKGEGRKHGLETLHMGYTREEIHLPVDSQAFLMIQHIRDESHRFAITNHRKQRSAHKIVSRLEQIEGIGSQKRRALLNHFGGINEITSASREEIAKVKGIGEKLAEVIYTALHKS